MNNMAPLQCVSSWVSSLMNPLINAANNTSVCDPSDVFNQTMDIDSVCPAVGGAWELFLNQAQATGTAIKLQAINGFETAAKVVHSCAQSGLAQAATYQGKIMAAAPDWDWEAVKTTIAPVTKQLPENVLSAVEYASHNPLAATGATAGLYLTGKGVSNLFNAQMTKWAASRQIAIGGGLIAGSLWSSTDAATRLIQLTTLSGLAWALWNKTPAQVTPPPAQAPTRIDQQVAKQEAASTNGVPAKVPTMSVTDVKA